MTKRQGWIILAVLMMQLACLAKGPVSAILSIAFSAAFIFAAWVEEK